jgi:hypothetical protein
MFWTIFFIKKLMGKFIFCSVNLNKFANLLKVFIKTFISQS